MAWNLNFSSLTPWLSRLGVLVTLGLALLLSSCTSSDPKIKGVPSNLPNIAVYGSSRTPSHSMNRADYPFDSSGNYVTAWAAEGRSSAGPSDYRSSRSHHDDDDDPPARRRTTTSSSSSSRSKVSSSPPKKSTGSTSSSTAAKKKSSGSGSSGGGSTRHVVKSGDSLWGLAKKYGTTVEKIKSANGLKGTNIRDGAALKIPK